MRPGVGGVVWVLRGDDVRGLPGVADCVPLRRQAFSQLGGNTGLAIQFAAAGTALLRQAEEAGVGRALPEDLFTMESGG